MNILLLGFIGSGKSSIGHELAKKLGKKFVEMDKLVLKDTGYDSIHEVYSKGISLWKEAELHLSKDLSLEDDMVIACGGGFLDNELNLNYFQENSKELKVIYLHTSPEILVERNILRNKGRKKKVDPKAIRASIEKIFAKRDFLYRYFSNHVVDTDNLQVKDAVAKITWLL